MATILLQAAGAAIGGLLGSAGAAIGTAAGAVAGYMIDQALIGSTRNIEGPRLTGPRPLSAEEGHPIPRLYGTARLGATVIWATRFEEQTRTERQGGKGGPKLTSYSYFANVALALCEGEIASVRRVWADGQEIDREQIELRFYPGTADQPPDPLIEARQGAGNTPAYRGIAYVVFERLPLEAYGNRVPQFQFEVIRPVGRLHRDIRAIALMPGATEHGLSPGPVTRLARQFWAVGGNIAGASEKLNRAISFASSDFNASLDELQALCPNLENVALVVSWFGDDLRAGHCMIGPRIVDAEAPDAAQAWKVSGLARAAAQEVSRHAGNPAFGGTPSDRSVMEAIAELKSRGLKITLYPFVMMDIAAGNVLADPQGGEGQPAYPWRGRITCDPAPGLAGTADRTALATAQIEAFCGSAAAAEFAAAGDTIRFTGSAGDWGYRRMVLHHAHLAAAAGGVDAFLIGSELRGLTTLRDGEGDYPFVRELMRLAEDVKQILGSATLVTYGADWSEYFGHQPQDGSGDVDFHLDPLWASDAIDAVGIDNYFPLSDWRDTDHAGGNPDGAASAHDAAALRNSVAGGEGYDWYYASSADRAARIRTPITDGAYGKPWVFRCKDLRGWWENAHHNRRGGVEQGEATAWTPCSKPIWFTELGCAAIDKGPNQPNLFGDPKSSESGRPHFSNGGRDDFAQRAFLEAHHASWDPGHPEFTELNPVSPIYAGRMVDPARIYVWSWDTRPFPAFPRESDRWSDGGNWPCGHWLNGRLGGAGLGDIIQAVLADHGLPPADTSRVSGMISGLVVDRPEAPRSTIEAIAELCGIAATETGGGLLFFDESAPPEPPVAILDRVAPEEGATESAIRAPVQELPHEVALTFRDPLLDFQTVTVRHGTGRRQASAGQAELALPIICETSRGKALAANWLRRQHYGRDRCTLKLPVSARRVRPGSVIELPFAGGTSPFIVTSVEDGICRQVEARRLLMQAAVPERAELPGSAGSAGLAAGPALAVFLDLPCIEANESTDQFRIAAWCTPWRPLVASASPGNSGFGERSTITQPATVGILESALAAGPTGRRDFRTTLEIRLLGGELASVSPLQLLNGSNVMAVRCNNGGWEVLQFELAQEIAAMRWRLTGLLRGQLGSEDAMASGASAGALVVMLDNAVVPAGLLASEIGLERRWRVQPAGLVSAADTTAESVETGGQRALTPLSPVHLKANVTADGGIELSWIRRGRIDADSWLGADIALGEEREAYVVRIRAGDGALLRETSVVEPRWFYPPAEVAADRMAGSVLQLEVCQISAASGEGIAASLPLFLT